MNDRELLTECLDVLTHDAAQRTFAGGVRMSQLAIKLRAALAAPQPESKTPAWWVDGLTVTLMREGVNKHRAREIAQGYWEAYCQIPETEEDIEALRRENERLQNLLYDQMGEMFALRAAEQMRKQIAELKHAENERLREALKLALNSHGRMLLTDPPQDPWKVNRVDEVIRELLQEVPR